MNELVNKQSINEGLRELALFAGAGGGILGGKLRGWRTVCAVEIEPYPASVLCARQNDGILETFPIWDDVSTFNGKPWRGRVDVVSGGFPCQDISAAGKGAGIENGKRSGLWREFARIIREVRPQYVLVENSPMLVSRGLGIVLGDLAAMGYAAEWGVLGACEVGAPHKRERIWIVADTNNAGLQGGVGEWEAGAEGEPDGYFAECGGDAVANTESERCREAREFRCGEPEERACRGGEEIDGCGQWWAIEPDVGRVAHGVAARVDRLRAIGNGQVPAVAATAFGILSTLPLAK